MEDKPMCERCERETDTTVDIWAQVVKHYDDETTKQFELGGRDYIIICEECWDATQDKWNALCEATTVDHTNEPNMIDKLIEGFRQAATETNSSLEQVAQVWAEEFDERMAKELAS